MAKNTSISPGGHFEAFTAALITGEESGPAAPFDFDLFLARKCSEYQAK